MNANTYNFILLLNVAASERFMLLKCKMKNCPKLLTCQVNLLLQNMVRVKKGNKYFLPHIGDCYVQCTKIYIVNITNIHSMLLYEYMRTSYTTGELLNQSVFDELKYFRFERQSNCDTNTHTKHTKRWVIFLLIEFYMFVHEKFCPI